MSFLTTRQQEFNLGVCTHNTLVFVGFFSPQAPIVSGRKGCGVLANRLARHGYVSYWLRDKYQKSLLHFKASREEGLGFWFLVLNTR